MAVFGMVLSIISPLLSEISKEFSLSLSQAGMFFTVSFTGFILFIFIGGFLAESLGKRKVISAALLGFSAALLAFAVSTKISYSLIAFFFIGGFGGIIESMISSYVSDLNIENTSYYINLSQIFLCVGAIIGPIFAGFALSLHKGWRISYYILSILTFVFFIAISNLRINGKSISEKINVNEFKKIVFDKKFMVICICLAFYVGAEVGVWGWMSIFLKNSMGFSIRKSAIGVGLFWVSMTIGRIICGKLIRVFRLRNITLFLTFASAVAVFLTGFLTSEISMWVEIIVVGLAFSSLYPLILAIGSSFRSNATAFAFLVGSGGIGSIVVPFFMGVIGDNSSIRIAMMSPSLLFIIIGILIMFRGNTEHS